MGINTVGSSHLKAQLNVSSSLSKSQIDKAGRAMSQITEVTIESLELEDVFDQYRASHLEPLSSLTLELQKWLHDYGHRYYIAQRLKRKPQIIRKLNRLSVRLTQLQDIGGCRIIVDENKDVDVIIDFIKSMIASSNRISLKKITDYRNIGRDETGYRSAHLIVEVNNRTLELQIRSRIQHYWAESIERTSIIYGFHLKEQEGNPIVISYFKSLSDIFYEIESGRTPGPRSKVDLEKLREQAQKIIYESDKNRIFDSFINEDVVKTLGAVQGEPGQLNNWIIVFNWTTGEFSTWDSVGRDTNEVIRKYVRYENDFPAEKNFEVVLIGASDIATVRQTHSHYFGIQKFDKILESLDESISGFKTKMDIDIGSRQILNLLIRKKYWGRKTILNSTLKNHFAKGIISYEQSIQTLLDKELVKGAVGPQSEVSLNIKKKPEIESYM